MNNTIVIKEIEEIRVVYIPYEGKPKEAGKLMLQVFKAIKAKSNGAPFFHILHVDQETGLTKIELCVPTNEEPRSNQVFVKVLPRIQAISITHKGSYETMQTTYDELEAYITTQQLEVIGPCREVYIKGPGPFLKGNPQKYITEILLPTKRIK